jgi:hypothetical protein
VVDRFRLVNEGTADLLDRLRRYYSDFDPPADDGVTTAWSEKSQSYAPGYVKGGTWSITLSADVDASVCTWALEGAAAQPGPCKGYPATVSGPARFTVTEPASGRTGSVIVAPRDILIASLGDSYASGEGVPDARYRKQVLPHAGWVDVRCHRALFSGPSLAALFYAHVNRHVSVTDVSLACSGAPFLDGVVKNSKPGRGKPRPPYQGIVKGLSEPALGFQIEDLIAMLKAAGRTPDFLTLSAGGNDLRFGLIIRHAAEHNKVLRDDLAWANTNVTKLGAYAEMLHARLEAELPVPRERLLITEYPNPTNFFIAPDGAAGSADEMDTACGYRSVRDGHTKVVLKPFLYGALKWLFWISHASIEAIDQSLVIPLSKELDDVADKLAATPVRGIDAEFQGHGYCAPGRVGDAMFTRWINTVGDSVETIGNWDGAMHPNIRGQAAIARQLLAHILDVECASDRLDAEVKASLCGSSEWQAQIPGYAARPTGDTMVVMQTSLAQARASEVGDAVAPATPAPVAAPAATATATAPRSLADLP